MSESQDLILGKVNQLWQTDLKLHLDEETRCEDGTCEISGRLSLPTMHVPVAPRCVKLHFRISDGANVEYCIEKGKNWYSINDFQQEAIENVLQDKKSLHDKYGQSIATAFMESRRPMQREERLVLEAKYHDNEESKIYRESKQASDNTYLSDDDSFLEQFEDHETASTVDIRALVTELFGNISRENFEEFILTYTDAVYRMVERIQLNPNCIPVLLGCTSSKQETARMVERLIAVTERLLTWSSALCEDIINDEYVSLVQHHLNTCTVPYLEGELAKLHKKAKAHAEANELHEVSVSHQEMREVLSRGAFGLRLMEANAIIGQLAHKYRAASFPVNVKEICHLVQKTRYASLRHRYLKYNEESSLSPYFDSLSKFDGDISVADVGEIYGHIAEICHNIQEMSESDDLLLSHHDIVLFCVELFANIKDFRADERQLMRHVVFRRIDPTNVQAQKYAKKRLTALEKLNTSILPQFSSATFQESVLADVKDNTPQPSIRDVIFNLSDEVLALFDVEAILTALLSNDSIGPIEVARTSYHFVYDVAEWKELLKAMDAEQALLSKIRVSIETIGRPTLSNVELLRDDTFEISGALETGEEYWGTGSQSDLRIHLGQQDLSSVTDLRSSLGRSIEECAVVLDSRLLITCLPKLIFATKNTNQATYIDDIAMDVNVYLRHDNFPYWYVEAQKRASAKSGSEGDAPIVYKGYFAKSELSAKERSAKSLAAFQDIFDRFHVGNSTAIVLDKQ